MAASVGHSSSVGLHLGSLQDSVDLKIGNFMK